MTEESQLRFRSRFHSHRPDYVSTAGPHSQDPLSAQKRLEFQCDGERWLEWGQEVKRRSDLRSAKSR